MKIRKISDIWLWLRIQYYKIRLGYSRTGKICSWYDDGQRDEGFRFFK